MLINLQYSVPQYQTIPTCPSFVREGKIEPISNPDSQEVSDQRNYLYVEFNKTTSPANGSAGVGTAISVKLKGDPKLYISNHNVPD